jgi:predicted aspartyl protease
LKLVAKIDDDGHAFLTALFWCSQFNERKRVNFLIDSGCTTTTILNDDAAFLGIDCSALPTSIDPVSTANGSVYPHQIPEAILIFRVKQGFLNLSEGYWGTKLIGINCHVPTNPDQINQYSQYEKDHSFSLLGVDFFQKFSTLTFNYKRMQLALTL